MTADKRMYCRRKENGLCTECGKPRDNIYVMCDACRNKMRVNQNETRKWYQQNGICPRCKKEKLYGDEKQCLECNAKSYEKVVNSRDRDHYNETHREWSKRTHHEAISKGICTRCRKRKADHGYKTCGICRAKDAEKKRLRNVDKITREEKAELGLCYWCMEPAKPGYKTCQRCYDRCVENSRKADRSNHIWKSMIPRDKRKEKVG